jgi:hypothetical protein
MATGWPMKTNYANGDVYSASDVNDTNGTINLLGSSVAYTAGKNKILNSDFGIWQRGTSSATQGIQTADRWFCVVNGTTTWSQDTSVPSGVSSQYSLKWTTGASSSFGQLFQGLERAVVQPMRSQAMVFSIYVKTTGTALSGTLALNAFYSNSTDAYGSQSTSVTITGSQAFTPTATWTRYSGTLTIPADAVGIKIGVAPSAVQASGNVVFFAGAQLEQGSTPTAFATATSSIATELAACQRYYFRTTPGVTNGLVMTTAYAFSSTIAVGTTTFPVTMRVTPTSIDTSDLRFVMFADTAYAMSAVTLNTISSNQIGIIYGTISGGTGGEVGRISASSATGYLGFSAEL